MARTRTRTVLAGVLLALALSLALATGAAVIDGDADTLADDRVAIQPADGSNGDYAYLDDDDELVIDVSASNPNLDGQFEGVNVNSRTVIADVFTVTYTADETADVWFDHDLDGVSFVVADDAADNSGDGSGPGYRIVDDEEAAVSLAPNESVSVGLVIDTTDRDAVAGTVREDDFAIHANVTELESTAAEAGTPDAASSGPVQTVISPSPSDRRFEVSDVEDGDTVRFDADEMHLDDRNVTLDRLDLVGASAGSYELEAAGNSSVDRAEPLDVAGDPMPIGYLTLEYDFDPDDVEGLRVLFSADPAFLEEHDVASTDVTLYRLTNDGAWEELDAAGVDERVVELRGSPSDRTHFSSTSDGLSVFAVAAHTPRIEANGLSIATDSIDAGAETFVEAVVENGGGAAGEHTLTLTADGDALATREVALEPGEETTVTFPVSVETAGEYELAVDGSPAGTLRVDEVDDGDLTDGDDTAPTGGDDGDSTDGDDGDPSLDDDTDADTADDGSGSIDDADGTDSDADEPTEEPGGFGLSEVGGLGALLFVVAASLFLARRAPSGS